MNFKGLDLNLLVALDALLEECSVSAAGRKVHLSQSAMSSALARLRRHFQDPLLVAVGRRMQPTPYALQLAGSVRSILLQIDTSMKGSAAFNPQQASRRFTIAASDYAVNVLLLEVQRRCADTAPGVILDIVPVTENTVEALNRGELDLLIVPDRYRQVSCPAETLFEDQLVCVAAQRRTPKGNSISLAAFKSSSHVVYQPEPGHVIAFDAWLHDHYGFEPAIQLYLYNYSLLPRAVVGTQRIATMPSRLAQLYATTLPIRILKPSFPMPPIVEIIQWHPVHANDAGLIWLIATLHEIASQTLASSGSQRGEQGLDTPARSSRR